MLTWGTFKAALAAAAVEDTDEIEFIDVDGFHQTATELKIVREAPFPLTPFSLTHRGVRKHLSLRLRGV